MALAIDPAGQSSTSLTGAEMWLERLLNGSLGTSIAVLAVAWLGFGMLTGTISLRRSGIVVLGCAILFSAPLLARSLLGLTRPGPSGIGVPVAAQPVPPPVPKATAPKYDPYAGAAVPSGGN